MFKELMIIFSVINLVQFVNCGYTMEQLVMGLGVIRRICQPKFNVNDELVDGIKAGKFPNVSDLKCYVNCVMELLDVINKGKIDLQQQLKNIDDHLPPEIHFNFKEAATTCKDVGSQLSDHCEFAYELTKCYYKNNPQFLFP